MSTDTDDNLGPERLYKLGTAVCAVFNRDEGTSEDEIIVVCINILATLIADIDCPGCRKETCENMKRGVAEALAKASRAAAMRPIGSDHLH
jgi:hypothetical protein